MHADSTLFTKFEQQLNVQFRYTLVRKGIHTRQPFKQNSKAGSGTKLNSLSKGFLARKEIPFKSVKFIFMAYFVIWL